MNDRSVSWKGVRRDTTWHLSGIDDIGEGRFHGGRSHSFAEAFESTADGASHVSDSSVLDPGASKIVTSGQGLGLKSTPLRHKRFALPLARTPN